MKVLSLFGLKYYGEYTLKFRYVVFLHQLKPKIYFEKQLQQFEIVNLDKDLYPKVSDRPDMSFISTVISRLLNYFEGLSYEETKNAIIYYRDSKSVFMLSKSTMTPVVSKGITHSKITRHDTMPEIMLKYLDDMIQHIIDYYITHWSFVMMYYNIFKRV